jgi:hypothetical protein
MYGWDNWFTKIGDKLYKTQEGGAFTIQVRLFNGTQKELDEHARDIYDGQVEAIKKGKIKADVRPIGPFNAHNDWFTDGDGAILIDGDGFKILNKKTFEFKKFMVKGGKRK